MLFPYEEDEEMKAKFCGLLLLCFLAGRATAEDSKICQDIGAKGEGVSQTNSERASMECPECRGIMEAGVVPDINAGVVEAQQWILGNFPVRNYSDQLKHLRIIGQQFRDGRVIVTYRCVKCGYLKSYAK
jgi:hypothetical protein